MVPRACPIPPLSSKLCSPEQPEGHSSSHHPHPLYQYRFASPLFPHLPLGWEIWDLCVLWALYLKRVCTAAPAAHGAGGWRRQGSVSMGGGEAGSGHARSASSSQAAREGGPRRQTSRISAVTSRGQRQQCRSASLRWCSRCRPRPAEAGPGQGPLPEHAWINPPTGGVPSLEEGILPASASRPGGNGGRLEARCSLGMTPASLQSLYPCNHRIIES